METVSIRGRQEYSESVLRTVRDFRRPKRGEHSPVPEVLDPNGILSFQSSTETVSKPPPSAPNDGHRLRNTANGAAGMSESEQQMRGVGSLPQLLHGAAQLCFWWRARM